MNVRGRDEWMKGGGMDEGREGGRGSGYIHTVYTVGA